MYAEWGKQWDQEITCRQTKQFFPSPNAALSKRINKLARSQLTLLIKPTTGHNALAYHASKMDPNISDLCGLCEEGRETFYHFVTECPRLRTARQECQLEDLSSGSWKVESLLELARVPAIEALLTRD